MTLVAKGTETKKPWLIVVTGPPAAGKTVTARRLAADLGLPLIEKDVLKEALYDTLGPADLAWSRRLGAGVTEQLYRLAERFASLGVDALLESNFVTDLATPRFLKIADKHPFRALQVVCTADAETIAARYARRAGTGERHPGHHDSLYGEEAVAGWLERHRPLDLPGPVVIVDSSEGRETPYEDVLAQVRQCLGCTSEQA
jgi:predicted kinase